MMSATQEETADTTKQSTSFEQMLIDCLGCKWTIILLDSINQRINRPGQLVKAVDGLTTKALNQNLNRMMKYGLLEKYTFAEIPPRVEYQLTPFGVELREMLLLLKQLQIKYLNQTNN